MEKPRSVSDGGGTPRGQTLELQRYNNDSFRVLVFERDGAGVSSLLEIQRALGATPIAPPVRFLILDFQDAAPPTNNSEELRRIGETFAEVDRACRRLGGGLILVAPPNTWDCFDVPVLRSVAGATLVIGLRDALASPERLPHFLLRTGVAYFVQGARTVTPGSPDFEHSWRALLFGLRQINSLPNGLQPTCTDARIAMDALAQFALTYPEFAARHARELRRLYERMRPAIFLELAQAAVSQN